MRCLALFPSVLQDRGSNSQDLDILFNSTTFTTKNLKAQSNWYFVRKGMRHAQLNIDGKMTTNNESEKFQNDSSELQFHAATNNEWEIPQDESSELQSHSATSNESEIVQNESKNSRQTVIRSC